MNKRSKQIFLPFLDFFTANIAWSLYYWFRVRIGWFHYGIEPDFWMPMLTICVFWLLVFFLFGLYRSWYAQSRFDEFTALFKATTFGALMLFFAIFIDDRGVGSPLQSRLLILLYWMLILICVGGGRFLQHTFQRRLLEAGIGLHNTLIVGWAEKARALCDAVQRYPALGFKVVGFVPVSREEAQGSYRNIPILDSIYD